MNHYSKFREQMKSYQIILDMENLVLFFWICQSFLSLQVKWYLISRTTNRACASFQDFPNDWRLRVSINYKILRKHPNCLDIDLSSQSSFHKSNFCKKKSKIMQKDLRRFLISIQFSLIFFLCFKYFVLYCR